MTEAMKTKTLLVLKHLKKHGSITAWEAIQLYRATRLSAIIFELRKDYNIESVRIEREDKNGDMGAFVRYVYHGPKDPDAPERTDENPIKGRISKPKGEDEGKKTA